MSRGEEVYRAHITPIVTGTASIKLPPSLARKWELTAGQSVHLSIGSSYKTRASIALASEDISNTNVIAVCLGTKSRISVPAGLYLTAIWDRTSKTVRVGPVIGIFTDSIKTDPATYHGKIRVFGSQSGTFKDLMRVARRENAFAYAFTPRDVDWAAGVIRGYCYITINGRARWVRRIFPFPDVVYNRVPTRSDEARPSIVVTKKRLMSIPGLKLYNSFFLNKWQVHKQLIANDNLQEFVIETQLWHGYGTVVSQLKRHGQVFLKPVSDSLGRGAMRVRRVHDGFTWEMNIPGRGTRRRSAYSVQTLAGTVSRVVGRRPYLVQRGIALMTVSGRPFDVRALVQKDSTGTWHVTGMAARVAQKNRITTHIPNGGSAHPLHNTLELAFSGTQINTLDVEERLDRAAVLAAKAIDSIPRALFGEVSLDMGIDTAGKVWIFEVNAKPFRFDEEHIRQVSLRRVVGFCAYLSGYTDNNVSSVTERTDNLDN